MSFMEILDTGILVSLGAYLYKIGNRITRLETKMIIIKEWCLDGTRPRKR